MYPTDYKYTQEHEWVALAGQTATVGITDYAQHALGDVVFVELPKPGAKFSAGQTLGTVESVKAVSEIYCPVSLEVTEVNTALANAPEKINQDPHGAAWMVKGRATNPGELSKLSDAERRAILAGLGLDSIEQLFASIPEACRLKRPLEVPGPLSEKEIIDYFRARAAENAVGYTSYLGAGVYNHLRSVVTDALIQRGGFLTSYTPYQAEISQGTLQAIFEFQTLMCQLTGQEVANASMYDGSTATTEAVLMAERLTGKRRVLVAHSVHPEYREVLKTYAKNSGLKVEEIGFTAAGTLDVKGLTSALRDDVCAVVVQSPNFFGAI